MSPNKNCFYAICMQDVNLQFKIASSEKIVVYFHR